MKPCLAYEWPIENIGYNYNLNTFFFRSAEVHHVIDLQLWLLNCGKICSSVVFILIAKYSRPTSLKEN